jgi:hypothetical protein
VHTAYAVGAVSILTLLTAGYFGLQMLGQIGEMQDHKHGSTCDSGVIAPRDNAALAQNDALVLTGVGVALGAVSVGLYFRAPQSTHGERSTGVSPSNDWRAPAGIEATGRW